MPLATKACVPPIATEAVAGVTAIELNVTPAAGTTVKVAEPDLAPNVAVIVAVPPDRPVATPGDTTVATGRLFEVHVTTLLMSKLVLSEK